MSSMPLCAAHHPMPDFNGDAIAQYMRTDFITLPDHLSVNGAREYFVSQLTTDDIPGQVFVVAGKALRGVLSIKRLLQEKDTSLNINHLTDSCLFHVKPDDERAQVVAELAEREVDLVAVVERGELVGCLMEKEIAHLQEDDVTEDVQLQGATLPLEKPYLEISPWTLWKKRSVWLLLLFVAEAYTSSVLQHFEEALESAIALAFFIPLLIGYWRQQRYADYFDAGTFNGAGRSAAARYGPGDPQRSFNFAADRSDAGPGRVLARVDDGHRYGNHADRQPDAGLHYAVERRGVISDPHGAQAYRH